MNPTPEPQPVDPSSRTGELDRALDLVRFLRAHCDWDAAQTPRSLIRYLLEEAHEVADAIRAESVPRLRDELGDLLLNLAFQIVIAEEAGSFGAADVAAHLETKMRRRHPHLYGEGERRSWESIKSQEGPADEGLLESLPSGLDPLSSAFRLQEKAAQVGFDWPDAGGALAKLREEVTELHEAVEQGNADHVADELGDVLFSVVNAARLLGHHPAEALDGTNRKFRRRFAWIEAHLVSRGLEWQRLTLPELDRLWEEAKAEDASPNLLKESGDSSSVERE